MAKKSKFLKSDLIKSLDQAKNIVQFPKDDPSFDRYCAALQMVVEENIGTHNLVSGPEWVPSQGLFHLPMSVSLTMPNGRRGEFRYTEYIDPTDPISPQIEAIRKGAEGLEEWGEANRNAIGPIKKDPGFTVHATGDPKHPLRLK